MKLTDYKPEGSNLTAALLVIISATQGYFAAKPPEIPIDWGALLGAWALAIAAWLKDRSSQQANPGKKPAPTVGSVKKPTPRNKPEGVPWGIWNNNPGNIKYDARNNWLGQIGQRGGFVQFSHMRYGVRAMVLLLRNYERRHGINTINGLINRWAPASDGNNVESYIKHVERVTGENRDAPIDWDDRDFMLNLAAVIAKHETGQDLNPVVLADGVGLALS